MGQRKSNGSVAEGWLTQRRLGMRGRRKRERENGGGRGRISACAEAGGGRGPLSRYNARAEALETADRARTPPLSRLSTHDCPGHEEALRGLLIHAVNSCIPVAALGGGGRDWTRSVRSRPVSLKAGGGYRD